MPELVIFRSCSHLPYVAIFWSLRLFLQVPLPLANATETGWAELQQMQDQVLAISALFGMFQVNIAAKLFLSTFFVTVSRVACAALKCTSSPWLRDFAVAGASSLI